MPNAQKHLNQYESNKKLLSSNGVDISNYPDWVITIAFYSAVHLIEKEFAQINLHSKSHVNRNEDIIKITKLKPITPQFATLEVLSKKARYQCKKFTLKDVSDAIKFLSDIEKVALQ